MGQRNLGRGAMRKDATAVCLALQTRNQVGRDVRERRRVTGGVGCLASLLICHDAPPGGRIWGQGYRRGGHSREGNLSLVFPERRWVIRGARRLGNGPMDRFRRERAEPWLYPTIRWVMGGCWCVCRGRPRPTGCFGLRFVLVSASPVRETTVQSKAVDQRW